MPLRPAAPGGADPALPRPLTSLVGREREVTAVRALLGRDGVRLVTLTGPGGVGKTRLALRVAEDLADFPDGIWFVALAPVRDPTLVAPTIAQALGVRQVAEQPVEQGIAAFLSDRSTLLILDNFEHVLDAGPLVVTLLSTCPSLTVLATSRAVLRISGEHVFAVPPLAMPDTERRAPLDQLLAAEAIRLFAERAAASASDFAITADNAQVVGAICRRLDGLPLAIELAAARVNSLSPTLLLGRLDEQLRLLTGGPRDQPPRLRSMRDAIAWSYDLLDSEEQVLFRRLAVFVGGWTLEAAEVVAATSADTSLLDTLASLIGKSLVRQEPAADGTSRYTMLETVREFALERLAESGEEAAIRQRHAEVFAALAEQAEMLLFTGNARWIKRLTLDHANPRAALAWAIEHGATETALRLVGALMPFWFLRGEFAEGRDWAERALALDGDAPPAVRVSALETACQHAQFFGDIARAVALSEEGLALARSSDDQLGIGKMLLKLGALAETQRHYDRAQALFVEAGAVFEALNDPFWVAAAVKSLGWASIGLGNDTEAERWAEEGLARERALGHPWGIADALLLVGQVARLQGDPARAADALRESLVINWREGHRHDVMWRLEAIAMLAADQSPSRAARLFGAAEAMRDEFGMALPLDATEGDHDSAVARVRAALGEQ
ncbi:MAG: AAA family ATPase, partial [Chloroflexota bacterium]|nr:AAA family ATPase [Chloroflexota bacterium]